MNKRIIITLSEDIVNKLDDVYKNLGLPSRNSYIEQCIRKQLGLPNAFEEQGG